MGTVGALYPGDASLPALASQPVEYHLAHALAMLAIPNIRRFLLEAAPDPMADAEILDHPMHRDEAYALALHRVVWGVKELESEHRASWLYTPAWSENNVIAGVAVRHDNSRVAAQLAAQIPSYPSGLRMVRFAIDVPQGNLLSISAPCPKGTVELQFIATRLQCTCVSVVAVLRASQLMAAAQDTLDLPLLRQANLFALTLRRRRPCLQCDANLSCRTPPDPPKGKLDFSSFRMAMGAVRGIYFAEGDSDVVAHIETRRVNTATIRVQLAILQLAHSRSIAALRLWGYRSRPAQLQGRPAALEFRRRSVAESAAAAQQRPAPPRASRPALQSNQTLFQQSHPLNAAHLSAAYTVGGAAAAGGVMQSLLPPVSLPTARNRPVLIPTSNSPSPAAHVSLPTAPNHVAIAPAPIASTMDNARNRNQFGVGGTPRIVKNPYAPAPSQSTYVSARDKRLEERRERNRRSAAKSNLVRKQARIALQKEIDEARKQVRKLEEYRDLIVQQNYELKAQLVTNL